MLPKFNHKFWVLGDQVLFSGTSFLLTLFLGRALGLSLFGIYSSFVILLFLMLSVAQATLVQPMQVRISQVRNVGAYIKVLLIIAIAAMVLLILTSMLFSYSEVSLFDLNSDVYFAFALFAAAFILHDFIRKIFLSTNKTRTCFFFDLWNSILLILALLVISVFHITELSDVFMLLAATYLPGLILKLSYFFSNVNGIGWEHLTYHWKEGRWFLMASISQWFSNNIFVMASGLFLSLKALGALRLVQTVFGVFNIALQGVENYMIPLLAKVNNQSEGNVFHLIQRQSKRFLPLVLATLALVFVFSEEVMILIGGAVLASYSHIMQGFCVLYAIIFFCYPVRISIRALALNKSFFMAYLISGFIGICSSKYLFLHFGLYAAAIGLIMNQLIMMSVWYYQLNLKKLKPWKLYIS